MNEAQDIHGGVVSLWHDGRWHGVLIEGPSGSGKSDLALRALERGFNLVSDDRTLLWVSDGALFGRAPETLAGLIEVRGLDVVRKPYRRLSRIDLVVACAAGRESIERLPPRQTVVRMGVELPLLPLWPFEPAAMAKLHHAARHLGGGR